ncbi:MAG: hypothetical protein BYD32DRAFT_405993 [Podila humilis]|nr:MAG: hypothetical protein BYD32DRAFT_405993 [Podila humilis]
MSRKRYRTALLFLSASVFFLFFFFESVSASEEKDAQLGLGIEGVSTSWSGCDQYSLSSLGHDEEEHCRGAETHLTTVAIISFYGNSALV